MSIFAKNNTKSEFCNEFLPIIYKIIKRFFCVRGERSVRKQKNF